MVARRVHFALMEIIEVDTATDQEAELVAAKLLHKGVVGKIRICTETTDTGWYTPLGEGWKEAGIKAEITHQGPPDSEQVAAKAVLRRVGNLLDQVEIMLAPLAQIAEHEFESEPKSDTELEEC